LKRILAIDTSSTWCSVALWTEEDASVERLAVQHESIGSAASQHLLPWIEALLKQEKVALHDLDAIAVGIGPGAFTGVRLGIAVVQGLAVAANRLIAPVASLDAIAASALEHRLIQEQKEEEIRFTVAIDARMGEVYWAQYSMAKHRHITEGAIAPLPQRLGDIHLSKPEGIVLADSVCAFGSAITEYPQHFERLMPSQLDGSLGVSATGVLTCAKTMLAKHELIGAHELEPLYVRNKVALTSAERGAK
jgi:tRNA threonylcarbamoyladenosine biosynthesis protein TsaB